MTRVASTIAHALVLTILAESGLGDDSVVSSKTGEHSTGNAVSEEGDQAATRCDARLVVAANKAPIGTEIEFTITIRNRSDKALTLLSPTFSPLARIETVDLLILDSEEKAVGELYRVGRALEGSAQRNARWFWQALPAREKFEKTDRIRLSVLRTGEEQLQPGKYKLQMVFFDKFLSEYPYQGLPTRRMAGNEAYRDAELKWLEQYTGKEIFRSNPVEIELEQQ